jgi:uncharacterized protein YlxW (UPF0749 family)
MSEPVTPSPPDARASRATTPLLTLITQESLDEDYRLVAARRAATTPGGVPPRNRWAAAAVIAVFGVLITVAAVQTSRNRDVQDAGRATLIAQIRDRKGDLEDQQATIADLQRGNIEAEGVLAQLSATSGAQAADVRRLKVRTGYLPVHGPGVKITVANPPDADPVDQVRDEDLAKLVDGLWAAGAEAIAINGQRLTVLSPIRNSGPAIHVNTRPLTAPYTILAIGDTRTLQAQLLNTTHGAEFFSLASQLGFITDVQNEDQMFLPAARLRRLVSVQAGTADTRKQEEDQP